MPKPHVFVAVYIGDSIAESKIVAASADQDLVSYVAAKLLREPRFADAGDDKPEDPIIEGRRRVLRLVETGGGES